jgi:hypothetical protein
VAVTDASLVSGRAPAEAGEAVVGAGIARQYGLSIGDRLALGGPSSPRVAVVEVVGTYRAPDIDGAGIVAPLATARHLTGVRPGEANVIRVDRPPEALADAGNDSDGSGVQSVVVTDLAVPETVCAGDDLVVSVTVENVGGREATRSVTVTARQGGASVSREIQVREGTPRLPTVAVAVTPSTPTVVTRPTARVDLQNPWSRPLEWQVRVTGPGGPTVRSVSLDPGESTTLSVPLARASVGDHAVAVRVADRTVARTSYRVQGDRRSVAAVASSGRYVAGSDLGQGVTSLLGNVELLLGALLVLAALATVGTATAGFAAAVHARRQTIGIRRATGAEPWAVLRLVLGDATRVCCVAVPPALVGGYLAVELLGAVGLLTAFGVTLVPSGVLPVVLLAGLAAFGLALVGATLATLPALRAPPAALLDDTD